MTRHYYHENEDVLRQAVAAIPSIGTNAPRTPAVALRGGGAANDPTCALARRGSVPARLKRLERYFAKGLISEAEHAAARQRILSEM